MSEKKHDPAHPLPRQWYTTNEAMATLLISRATLWKRINDGSLASRKLGGKRLIAAYAVEARKE